jgi:hypothetical protein
MEGPEGGSSVENSRALRIERPRSAATPKLHARSVPYRFDPTPDIGEAAGCRIVPCLLTDPRELDILRPSPGSGI